MTSWDKKSVIAAIRRMWRERKTISYKHIARTQSGLAAGACRLFGTYRLAVIAAGIDYDRDVRQHQSWSKQLVIQAIRRRNRQKEDLSPSFMSKNVKSLYQAGLTHFGSYRNAVNAAGIDYEGKVLHSPGWRWPEKRVLEEIKRQHRAGKDLSYNAMRKRCEPLVLAAARRFGSYPKALQEAGIDPASVKAVRRWNRDRVIAALMKLHKSGKDLSSTALKRSHGALYIAAGRHFPSFAAALAAAAIDVSSVRRQEDWSKEKVMRSLRKLRGSRKKLAINTLQRQQPRLLAAAIRHFGSYAAALAAIGIDYQRDVVSMRQWTKQEVIKAIQARQAAGKSLRPAMVRREDGGLLIAAQRRLRSWPNAVKAAGIDYANVLPSWNESKVLAALRQLAASGQDMQREAVLGVASGLVQAARKQFGGYYLALAKAGIDSPKSRGGKSGVVSGAAAHWNKQSVLRTLRELHREAKDLRFRSMKASHHSLFWASTELFGSYPAAVAAAGIDYEKVVHEQLRQIASKKQTCLISNLAGSCCQKAARGFAKAET